jgi:hypothetical protein
MVTTGVQDELLRQALIAGRYGLGRGQRPEFVPFNVRIVLARLTRERGVSRRVLWGELRQWARELGGDLVEGEVLWLPVCAVADLRLDESRRYIPAL